MIVGGFKSLRIDAEVSEQALSDGTVRTGIFERLAAAVADDRAAIELELIALRVTAEIIVIVENQDTRIGMFLPIKMGGRQSTDAGADNNQIVNVRLCVVNAAPILSPPPRQLVGHFVGARMASVEPTPARRVADGCGLRRFVTVGEHAARHCRGRGDRGGAIEKIAARDGAIHSQFFVAEFHGLQLSIQNTTRSPHLGVALSAEELFVVRVVQRLLDDRRLSLFPD